MFICSFIHRYPDYREPPWVEENRRYKFTSYYWRLLAVRLSFVVVFENVIATITSLMRWIIPDVPQQLHQQMRQHAYLTNELILQQEFQRAKEISDELKVQQYQNVNKINSSNNKNNRRSGTTEGSLDQTSIDSSVMHTVVNFPNTNTSDHQHPDQNESKSSLGDATTSTAAQQHATIPHLAKGRATTIFDTDYVSLNNESLQNESNGSIDENHFFDQYLTENTSQDKLIVDNNNKK